MGLDLESVVRDGKLPKAVAEQYLGLYVADIDNWRECIDELYRRLVKKFSQEKASESVKQAIACTVLLPSVDSVVHRSIDKNAPEGLLYRCMTYKQFKDKDWFSLLQKTIAFDIDITKWRSQALRLGIIDPLEYQPLCREAFNRLYNSAFEADCITDQNKSKMSQRFEKLVWAYGGSVISKIFNNHEQQVRKVLNWRTGYFFERTIFQVYDVEQVLKIKKQEMEKTNTSLIKRIQVA